MAKKTKLKTQEDIFQDAAKKVAEHIWEDDAEHENYDEYIKDFNDPRDHVLYQAALVLGHEDEFDDDIKEYLEE